jgi:hypothetical protein
MEVVSVVLRTELRRGSPPRTGYTRHRQFSLSSATVDGVVVADNWYAGNAGTDGDPYRGWLVGHFIAPDGGTRQTDTLEIKWGIHPAGEHRVEWTTGEDRTTIVIMVRGRFRVDLSVGTVTLEREGDYATWGPGIEHSWQAEEDSIVITIRWPSLP